MSVCCCVCYLKAFRCRVNKRTTFSAHVTNIMYNLRRTCNCIDHSAQATIVPILSILSLTTATHSISPLYLTTSDFSLYTISIIVLLFTLVLLVFFTLFIGFTRKPKYEVQHSYGKENTMCCFFSNC